MIFQCINMEQEGILSAVNIWLKVRLPTKFEQGQRLEDSV